MEKLKELREKKKLSYSKMAARLGISKPFYWQIENGQRRLSYEMAVKIAKVFRSTPDKIFYQEFKNKVK